jgi:hypothetical protein
MRKCLIIIMVLVFAGLNTPLAGQAVRLPDLSNMKHITTRDSDHATDIPGKETAMDFYSDGSGTVYTVYTFRGRTVAFSVHSNSDPQKTYRVYMDMDGAGIFQPIAGGPWQIPAWAR